MTKLVGIAIRHKKRAPMQTLDKAFISLERGVENDYRGKPSNRQVTLMTAKDWQDASNALQLDLPWTTRRANLLVDELEVEDTKDRVITIGNAKLLVTGETDPCNRMEEAATGLYEALKTHWRGGVSCRVIQEGTIKIGDEVSMSTQ